MKQTKHTAAVLNANRLQDYYVTVGRVYEGDGANLVLPPPAPG